MEGCQDLVQLSTPLPSVSAAMASSTGLDAITLPVALVATGAVVGAGATTAMTAPVATSSTPRPSTSRPARRHVLRTRRVWRAYVHDHPRRARRPTRARCPPAHGRGCELPGAARPAPAASGNSARQKRARQPRGCAHAGCTHRHAMANPAVAARRRATGGDGAAGFAMAVATSATGSVMTSSCSRPHRG